MRRSGASQSRCPRLPICVLPFANISDDPQQEYFSDGISEDIITASQRCRRFQSSRAIPRSPSRAGPWISNRWCVNWTLGTFWKGAFGRWAPAFASPLNWWTAQMTATFGPNVTTAISLTFLRFRMKFRGHRRGAETEAIAERRKQAIERRGTSNVEAYDLYLMARSYHQTGNGIAIRGRQGRGSSRPEPPGRGDRSRLRPGLDSAGARASTTSAAGFGRAGDGGQAALDRALALDPDLAEARALRAGILANAGRQEEATAEIAVALRLDSGPWR